MSKADQSRKSSTLVDLGAWGRFGQFLGAVLCLVGGIVGGAVGVVVWGVILLFLPCGFIGRTPLNGIVNVAYYAVSGGWLVGVFGLIPGAIVGFAFAVSNRGRFWGISMLAALVLGYVIELGIGYPTNILGVLLYIGAPVQAVWFSFVGAMFVKARFGLLPLEEETE